MKNATEIVVVADRSGSMMGLIEEMLKGYNGFIEEQKKDPSPANVTLILFDDKVETVYKGEELSKVLPLTREVYFARGGTALNDALGSAIDETGARLAAMNEEDRPNKVIVMVMTDGEENSSAKYSGEKIKEMVKHQQDVYKWSFMFLGVDIDAYYMGNRFGIAASNIISGKADKLDALYAATTRATSWSRGIDQIDGSLNFYSDEDKKEAEE